jgi:hypothetical protein
MQFTLQYWTCHYSVLCYRYYLFYTTLRLVDSDHNVNIFVFSSEIFHITKFECRFTTVKNNIGFLLWARVKPHNLKTNTASVMTLRGYSCAFDGM